MAVVESATCMGAEILHSHCGMSLSGVHTLLSGMHTRYKSYMLKAVSVSAFADTSPVVIDDNKVTHGQ